MGVIGQHLTSDVKAELIRRLSAGEVPAWVARDMGIQPGTAQRYAREISSAAPNRVETSADSAEIRDQFSAYEAIHAPKPRIRVKAFTSETPPDGPIYRVMVMGDAHDRPGRDKERFKWIGRMASERLPDAFVCIGDVASFDSLSAHETPGSQADAERPSFHQELDSLDEALGLFHSQLPVGSLPIFITLGNHEHRTERAANRQPKLNGDMPIRLNEVFARYRWQARPFGEFLDLYGVDLVHCPLNVMGREMGGEHVERTVANKALRSLVFGHTHRAQVVNMTKVGQHRRVTVVNVGTAMPWGIVEKYTGLAMSGWSYGAFELRIQSGTILSAKHWDMLELAQLYGD